MPTDQQPRSEPAASAQPPGRRTLPVHKCDICGRQFTRAFNLRSHLLSHGTQRPFPCSICGRSFVRHNDCKEHEKRHGGDKPFICKESSQDGTSRGCGRCFARKTHLLRHQRSKAFKACTGPVEGVVEEQVHENGDDEPAVQATEHVLPDSRSQTFSPVRRPASLKDILDWWERPVDARTTGMVDSCTWDQLLSTLSTELAQLDIFLQEQGMLMIRGLNLLRKTTKDVTDIHGLHGNLLFARNSLVELDHYLSLHLPKTIEGMFRQYPSQRFYDAWRSSLQLPMPNGFVGATTRQ